MVRRVAEAHGAGLHDRQAVTVVVELRAYDADWKLVGRAPATVQDEGRIQGVEVARAPPGETVAIQRITVVHAGVEIVINTDRLQISDRGACTVNFQENALRIAKFEHERIREPQYVFWGSGASAKPRRLGVHGNCGRGLVFALPVDRRREQRWCSACDFNVLADLEVIKDAVVQVKLGQSDAWLDEQVASIRREVAARALEKPNGALSRLLDRLVHFGRERDTHLPPHPG